MKISACFPSSSLVRLAALVLISIVVLPIQINGEFIKGVDLSITKRTTDDGIHYKWGGRTTDPLLIFKSNGCNFVRLRLFVNASGADGRVNTTAYTLAMARQVKQEGLGLLLDLHYSDDWADARKQSMPPGWTGLTRPQLVQCVHDYTLATLQQFNAAGCTPDIVQVGNEINNGLLWPAGGPITSDGKWPQFIELLKSAVQAVREAAPPGRIRVMIHLDSGGNMGISQWFYSHCAFYHLDYDIIGLSFYPSKEGTLDILRRNLACLSQNYDKDIIIVETAYPFTGPQGDLPYPATPLGQKQFLSTLMSTVAATPFGHGRGVFYWEPTWIRGDKWGGPAWSPLVERQALFDRHGNALPAIADFLFEPSH